MATRRAPLLLAIGALGGVREGSCRRPSAAPAGGTRRELTVPMSLGVALAVVAAWVAVPLAVGGWRTATRDA